MCSSRSTSPAPRSWGWSAVMVRAPGQSSTCSARRYRTSWSQRCPSTSGPRSVRYRHHARNQFFDCFSFDSDFVQSVVGRTQAEKVEQSAEIDAPDELGVHAERQYVTRKLFRYAGYEQRLIRFVRALVRSSHLTFTLLGQRRARWLHRVVTRLAGLYADCFWLRYVELRLHLDVPCRNFVEATDSMPLPLARYGNRHVHAELEHDHFERRAVPVASQIADQTPIRLVNVIV